MSEKTAVGKQIIAIIGGGFSGTMMAVHLISQNKSPVHIILINARYPLSKGIAFSSYSNKHLLNVPAGKMSAFPDKQAHFTNWLKNHEKYGALDQNELPNMFLPRNIYGYYLKDVFENAIRKKTDNITLEFVHDEAIDVELTGNTAQIYFSVSPPLTVNKIVLALGNPDPRPPTFNVDELIKTNKYFPNPWLNEAVIHDESVKDVLIIGNGLTMVDVVIGLYEHKFSGKIYAISPHGFKILPHRKFDTYTALLEDVKLPYDLNELIKVFRHHVKKLRASGQTGEAAVDSLRPLTQKIWMTLKKAEKERFLYHLRHMWGVARHRLPRELHNFIQQLILDEKLEIIAGKITEIHQANLKIKTVIQKRFKRETLELSFDRIINCTGPESDILRIKNPLIQNLLFRNYIIPDELHLGINATAQGEIVSGTGSISSQFYILGHFLKGILWETTAVPEIRNQAKLLSEIMLKHEKS